MTALFLAAQLVALPVCTTVQPSPAFVCHDGGWLPPGHPLLPQAPPVPPTPPAAPQPVLVPEFRVGRTYRRPATGVRIHIAALGAVKAGVAVFAAECLNQVDAEQCWYPGVGRFIVANAQANDWVEEP